MNFTTNHSEGLSAWVDVVEARFDCPYVSAEFLVNTVVGLRDCLIGVLDEAAAKAGAPGSGATAALSPSVEAFTVEGEFWLVRIALGELDVFGLSGESLVLIVHIECL